MLQQLRHRHQAYTQNFLCGIVLALTVGCYFAVIGLGAGAGQASSTRLSDISNTSLYAVFGVAGFFSGSILNRLGLKWSLLIGSSGYPVYVGGLFVYDKTSNEGLAIAGGLYLGFSASLLWAVCSYVQWTYATEREKGTYIVVQITLNNIGHLVGSLVAFCIIIGGASTATGSPTGVYVAFIVIMLLALFVAYFGLISPNHVRRKDGTEIAHFSALSASEELMGIPRLFVNWRFLVALPVLFSTELDMSASPTMNALFFTLRTRAFNALMQACVTTVASYIFRYALDNSLRRRTRALLAVFINAVFCFASWSGFMAWWVTSPAFQDYATFEPVDFSDPGYGAEFFLYIVIKGISSSLHMTVTMWLLSAFSNSAKQLSVMSGMAKGVGALGACVIFALGSAGYGELTKLIFIFASQGLACLLQFVLAFTTTESNYGLEEDVVVPIYALSKAEVLEGQDSVSLKDHAQVRVVNTKEMF